MKKMEKDQVQVGDLFYGRFCIVCGQSVDVERAITHLKIASEMITICCPMCFERAPDKFLALRAAHTSSEARRSIARPKDG
jgi:hypothetical protein